MVIILFSISILIIGLLYGLGYWAKEKQIKDTWQGAKSMEINKANKLSDNWEKAHPVLSFFQSCYYGIWRKSKIPGDTYRNIKWFIQRGKRGFSERDVWGFDYYLSDVIINGLKDLQSQVHGCPCGMIGSQAIDVDEKPSEALLEWKRIIGEMIWTFEVTKKIQDMEWIQVLNEKQRTKLEKAYNSNKIHVMTKEEIKQYKQGWKYFQEYYFNLWD